MMIENNSHVHIIPEPNITWLIRSGSKIETRIQKVSSKNKVTYSKSFFYKYFNKNLVPIKLIQIYKTGHRSYFLTYRYYL